MNQSELLIPGKGLLVRDPVTKDILPESGEVKPLIGSEGRYWRRRINDGSVTIGGQPLKIKSLKTREE